MVLSLIDAVVTSVKSEPSKNHRSSADVIIVKHMCCGKEHPYKTYNLDRRTKRAREDKAKYPKLCPLCTKRMHNEWRKRNNKEGRAAIEHIEFVLPIWKPAQVFYDRNEHRTIQA
jgi:hypothetical protein